MFGMCSMTYDIFLFRFRAAPIAGPIFTVHSVRFALLNEHFMTAVLTGTTIDEAGFQISLNAKSTFHSKV